MRRFRGLRSRFVVDSHWDKASSRKVSPCRNDTVSPDSSRETDHFVETLPYNEPQRKLQFARYLLARLLLQILNRDHLDPEKAARLAARMPREGWAAPEKARRHRSGRAVTQDPGAGTAAYLWPRCRAQVDRHQVRCHKI